MSKYKDYTPPVREDGEWLNLKQGENRIRIVSEFGDFGRHYDSQTKKTSACIGKKERCPICVIGGKPTVNFLVWVIDRADGDVKLLRYGYMIQDQIKTLSDSSEYSFDIIPGYDMIITRKGEGLATEYTVMASRQDTPLTDIEKDKITLKIKPVEEIIEKMKAKVVPVEIPKERIKDEDIPVINTDKELEDEEKIKEEDLPF